MPVELEAVRRWPRSVPGSAGRFAGRQDHEEGRDLRQHADEVVEVVRVGQDAVDDRVEAGGHEVRGQRADVPVTQRHLPCGLVLGVSQRPHRAGPDHPADIVRGDTSRAWQRTGEASADGRLARSGHAGDDPGPRSTLDCHALSLPRRDVVRADVVRARSSADTSTGSGADHPGHLRPVPVGSPQGHPLSIRVGRCRPERGDDRLRLTLRRDDRSHQGPGH
ncbi:hypothetical protein QP735_02370 [Curtobacterium citreum]|nr:hypothetical protein [Curtobacterium citreum]